MRQTLQVGLKQQLCMTPELQQAIHLLQLSSVELALEINTFLASNILLEQEEESQEAETHIEALDNIEEEDTWTPNPQREQDLLPQQIGIEQTLRNYLIWQLEIHPFTARETAIATCLIDAISEEGYLTISLKESQDSLGSNISLSEIEMVLSRIQQFEPLGVGARNLSECLSIQLNALPPDTLGLKEAKNLALYYLEYLGKRDYTRLKNKLKLNNQQLIEVIKILTALNPKPGNRISYKRNEYIIPDLIVKKKNQHFVVKLNKSFMPRLKINENYESLIQRAATKGDMKMLKDQLKEAQWFLKNVKSRNTILWLVTKHIMEAQEKFLTLGETMMKPLLLQDIAKKVGLHESTVSRITTQKYVSTPQGVFELKYFFSNSINTKEEPTSTTALRALIKKIIREESIENPLRDHQIMQILKERGITVVRRTISKYREAMHIPTSDERRHLNCK